MAQKYKIEWPLQGDETKSVERIVTLKSAVKIGTGPKATIKVPKYASKNVKPNHVTIALQEDTPRITLNGPVWINGDPYTEGEYGLDNEDTFVLGHEDNTTYTWTIVEAAEEAEESASGSAEEEEKEKTPEKKTPAKKDSGKKTPSKKAKSEEEKEESSAEESEKTSKGKAPKGKAGNKKEATKAKKGASKSTKLTKKKGQPVKKQKKKTNEDSSSDEETSDEFEAVSAESVEEKEEKVKDKETIHLSPPHRNAQRWKLKKGEKRTRAQPDRLDPKNEPAYKRPRTDKKDPIEFKAPPTRTAEELDHLTIRDCVIEAVELNPGRSQPQLHSFVDRYYKPLRVNREYYNGLIQRLLETDEIATANGLFYEKGQAPDEEVADEEASKEEKDQEMKEDASED